MSCSDSEIIDDCSVTGRNIESLNCDSLERSLDNLNISSIERRTKIRIQERFARQEIPSVLARINFKHKRSSPSFVKYLKNVVHPFMNQTRLIIAASFNHREMVQHLLIKEHINPNIYDTDGRAPLHIAVSKGYTSIIHLLLKYGADPNIQDQLKNTPLHLAACTSNLDIVKLLLRCGANPKIVDNNGRSPEQLVKGKLQVLKRHWETQQGDERSLKIEMLKNVKMIMLMVHALRNNDEKIPDDMESLLNDLQQFNISD